MNGVSPRNPVQSKFALLPSQQLFLVGVQSRFQATRDRRSIAADIPMELYVDPAHGSKSVGRVDGFNGRTCRTQSSGMSLDYETGLHYYAGFHSAIISTDTVVTFEGCLTLHANICDIYLKMSAR